MNGETGHQEHIGPYRLLARLGSAGSGSGGRAHAGPSGAGVGDAHRAAGPDGRDVAIRLLPPGARPDVQRMRGVLSPYVVDVLDGDPATDPPYVVSRFVPGKPLGDVVAESGPILGAGLRRFALGLAKALAAIHREGLAHGDLRPGTVLVVDGAPVVVDFGLCGGAPAEDIYAWAAVVAFAATAGDLRDTPLPEPLVPLIQAASADHPADRPSAGQLAEACAALDLGPSPVSAGAAVPAPRQAPQEPSPQPAAPDREAGAGTNAAEAPAWAPGQRTPAPSIAEAAAHASVRSAPAPSATEPSEPAPPAPTAAAEADGVPAFRQAAARHELAVTQGWARLLGASVVVIAVGVAVMMPVVGLVLSVAGVMLLRAVAAGTVQGWAGAVGRTVLTFVPAAAVAAAVPLGLVGISAVGGEIDALGACAFGAGAGAAVLWTVPGANGPRRRLEALFLPVARVPRRIALAGVPLGLLALVAVVGAMSLTPSFAPMYGLQSSLESSVDRLQTALR
ncbi:MULTISPECIES: hypothetical protein [Actinomadura]|uniref:Protein kinase domain-containing protein n=1 Tax=Actinomadura yumaensis TaxID=111807 RepID=A0ABW2CB01_9ACTN|nr:hypothetical protein [Actinomadura sp. J1-007]